MNPAIINALPIVETITTIPSFTMMDKADAIDCVSRIKDQFYAAQLSLQRVRRDLARLYSGNGHLALGYSSWRECATTEFSESVAQVYRQLKAANVEQSLSPIGEIDGTLPETHARELPANDPEAQRAIMAIATSTAPNGIVTASHIRAVTTVIKEIIITGAMDDGSGEMKPLGTLINAAVTEEAYERLMRQKQVLADSGLKKFGSRVLNAPVALMQAKDMRALLRLTSDTQAMLDSLPANAEFYLVAYVKSGS